MKLTPRLLRLGCCALVGALSFPSPAPAQEITPTMGITLPVLGKVTPRAAKDIVSSPWSIGAETIDRDFTVYANF